MGDGELTNKILVEKFLVQARTLGEFRQGLNKGLGKGSGNDSDMDSIKGSGSVWAKIWVVRCKGYEEI